MIDEITAQRFWAKINKDSGRMFEGTPCWLWTGSRSNGYGQFGGMNAHRYVWTEILGRDADGQHVHHRCEFRSCCQPLHLEALTLPQHFTAHKILRMSTEPTLFERVEMEHGIVTLVFFQSRSANYYILRERSGKQRVLNVYGREISRHRTRAAAMNAFGERCKRNDKRLRIPVKSVPLGRRFEILYDDERTVRRPVWHLSAPMELVVRAVAPWRLRLRDAAYRHPAS
jgi:hypothetical protein